MKKRMRIILQRNHVPRSAYVWKSRRGLHLSAFHFVHNNMFNYHYKLHDIVQALVVISCSIFLKMFHVLSLFSSGNGWIIKHYVKDNTQQ